MKAVKIAAVHFRNIFLNSALYWLISLIKFSNKKGSIKMKKTAIIGFISVIFILTAVFAIYRFLLDNSMNDFRLITKGDSYSIYEVPLHFSHININPLKVSLPDPIVFSAVDKEKSRDIFCLYENGALYNITNTNSLNEIKLYPVDNSHYLAMEVLVKGKKSSVIGFVDLKKAKYYLIKTVGNCDNLVASQDAPLIAFADTIKNRWNLVVIDLSTKQLLFKEYSPENNSIPCLFSDSGKYIYWLKGYPELKKVKSIMRTDISAGSTATVLAHDYKKHQKLALYNDMLYFSIADDRAGDREIYRMDLKTSQQEVYLSEENASVFTYSIYKGIIAVSMHESLVKQGENPAEIPKRQTMQRIFDSQVDFHIRELQSKETLAVIERAASLAFDPGNEKFIVFSTLTKGEGMEIGILNLENSTRHMFSDIPYKFPNYGKFLTLDSKYHFWLKLNDQ